MPDCEQNLPARYVTAHSDALLVVYIANDECASPSSQSTVTAHPPLPRASEEESDPFNRERLRRMRNNDAPLQSTLRCGIINALLRREAAAGHSSLARRLERAER